MDPIIVALICAASFGAVASIAAFVRQLILSRDKNLNDEALRRAQAQSAAQLEKMREQMQSHNRFDSHYKVLGTNKEAITYLDNKIEEILNKKIALIERYSLLIVKESGAIVSGQMSRERKEVCDKLKLEVDKEIKFYDGELLHFQKRRTALWDTHKDLQENLLKQEKMRNASLDEIYKQHSSLLEKIDLRYNENAEHVAIQSINAGTSTFKAVIMAPIHFLLQYFTLSSGIYLTQAQIEQAARDDVKDMEDEINKDDLVRSNDPVPDDAEKDGLDPDEDNRLVGGRRSFFA
jgi:hypothetical protein